jgi:hypothetical protein
MPQQRQHPANAARQRAYRARQTQARRDELHAKGLPPVPPQPPQPPLPSRARWDALLVQARLSLETARDEMHAYYDDRSEAWQNSERAATLADHIDQLETLIDALDALSPF